MHTSTVQEQTIMHAGMIRQMLND